MKLILTKEDQAKAGSYFDGSVCIIATALKRRFPKIKHVFVSGVSLELGRTRYDIRNFGQIHRYNTTPSLLPVTIELHKRGKMSA